MALRGLEPGGGAGRLGHGGLRDPNAFAGATTHQLPPLSPSRPQPWPRGLAYEEGGDSHEGCGARVDVFGTSVPPKGGSLRRRGSDRVAGDARGSAVANTGFAVAGPARWSALLRCSARVFFPDKLASIHIILEPVRWLISGLIRPAGADLL